MPTPPTKPKERPAPSPAPQNRAAFIWSVADDLLCGVYFAREVLPHMPDAWMDRSKDKIGYEINFTRYFYQYKPLRPLEEIKTDILKLEEETEGLLKRILS